MRLNVTKRALAVFLVFAALLTMAMTPQRSNSLPCSLYRGYLAGRQSGAMLYSIVQAVGTSAVCDGDPQRSQAPSTNPT